MTDVLQGTMKPYYSHILIVNGKAKEWPEKVEKNSNDGVIQDIMKTVKNLESNGRIMVTTGELFSFSSSSPSSPSSSSLPSSSSSQPTTSIDNTTANKSSPETPSTSAEIRVSTSADISSNVENNQTQEILVFPSFIKAKIPLKPTLELLSSLITPRNPVHVSSTTTTTSITLSSSSPTMIEKTNESQLSTGSSLNGISMYPNIKHIILVCAHLNRDQRCGVIGPLVIEEVLQVLKEKNLSDQVQVYATSHVGGKMKNK